VAACSGEVVSLDHFSKLRVPMAPSLPLELLNHIVSYASNDTLSILCRISREWHAAAIERLYHSVALKATGWNDDDDESEPEPQAHELFLRTLSGRLNLGCMVMYLDVDWGDSVPVKFIPALRQMPNLRHLGAPRLGDACRLYPVMFSTERAPNMDAIEAISNLDQLDSIAWADSEVFDMDLLLSRIRPLRAISYKSDYPSPALNALVIRSGSILQSLYLVELEFANLAAQLAKTEVAVVFPQLKRLELHLGLDLRWLQGPHFTAVEHIVCTYLRSRGLFNDNYLLPNLRAIAYTQNYHIDTYETLEERHPLVTLLP